ncbi:radical SAM protein [Desulfurivibrio alkaliphilus]|uniref:Radical SAM domain protein n=1 Tax=Desulfurivibrio alkaliphilus (strain DSM 19089 / UNIQEM U267 / AHT2) TaxID=589865 RepID=D6Z6E9_DESAT|nr:radical SAM protein [Desulfurivibrio alkaliphilus]ADH86914.1 Radical SAM domain protein [Desulfurivibrio alkaliphilus AHT 2]
MNFIFGPVNSRRLGISLGLDLLPPKICNFNCIYCEVGPTTEFTCKRDEYTPTAAIIAEIEAFRADPAAVARLDVVTITASGEPTLHSGLGEIIAHCKRHIAKPVAVLSNGSLLPDPGVRRELALADIIIPSLDAAREESFRKINRPARECRLGEIIDGLAAFRQEFTGHYWLEILLAKGINDTPEDLAALAAAVKKINPERIQLNTVARPPLESFARPLSIEELRAAAALMPGPVDILTDRATDAAPLVRDVLASKRGRRENEEEVLHLLQRRPCTAADISTALGMERELVDQALARLQAAGRIGPSSYRDREYYIVLPQGQEQPQD